jgi:hypothetical protein
MTRSLTLLAAVGAGALALGGSSPLPSALGQAQPGMWEINGVPGAAYPLRQCVADLAMLARFEHRAKTCTSRPVRDGANMAVIDYSCGPANFGHSEITVVTPRALRIETQGISGGLPFNYVLQAHRIADCPSAARH